MNYLHPLDRLNLATVPYPREYCLLFSAALGDMRFTYFDEELNRASIFRVMMTCFTLRSQFDNVPLVAIKTRIDLHHLTTTSMQTLIDDLEKSFSKLSTKDDKKSALLSCMERLGSDSQGSLIQLYGCPGIPKSGKNVDDNDRKALEGLIARHGLQDDLFDVAKALRNESRLALGTKMPPPLSRLGCANQIISKSQFCPKDGTMTCSGCFLVRYCSKECQSTHWKSHKQDCKNPLKSTSWSPAWIKEKRSPAFIDDDDVPPSQLSMQSPFGMGVILWGNIEAIDIISAKHNEGLEDIRNRDLSIAFIASGDLRNVVRTINELPEDYSGSIKIVLNDKNPMIVCRNLLILSILGVIADVEEGAEHALHLWYSVFQPLSYQTRILLHLCESATFKNLKGTPSQLTSSTTMHTVFSSHTVDFLSQQLSMDYRDRYYEAIKPSHRVAFERWRSFGLVLPFGAANSHMAIPNKWLFTYGHLMLNDCANPFEGWNLDEMFKAGKAHGTTEDDLIGCLFFYVKNQLVEFSNRLRRFKIHIYSFDEDARVLQRTLKGGPSFPQSFDRIEVSNIVDKNYVGDVPNPHAAIVGLFMNWPTWKESGNALSSESAGSRAMKKMAACPYAGFSPKLSPGRMMSIMNNLNMFHDTSPAFEEYLRDEKEAVIARKAGLRRRRIHKIVPHRCYTKLGMAQSELPSIDSAQRWYRVASLHDRPLCFHTSSRYFSGFPRWNDVF
ncbi:uncharacterized protein EV420DRAFT_1587760 [Desarmillaria tabescens]|uniref:MYND-type domain-containing protein n=1 Tax=Armillaria tabescens TaxID=1929756 RepID=A0AA39JBE8_ARMTA|nr:uncharacterized protein EV420DRAFT_1587760 [Desarmillaria tabescens]KAK0437608.1 hypothetical protein EV420DRAFT_1587760 [Desarmillaria tabescens]